MQGRVIPDPNPQEYNGPAFLSYGFRPFFLIGSLYSGFSVSLWLPQFYGVLELSTLFAPVDWHIHEIFFGYISAVITGFLFTAVPNWTGRMPIQGMPLLLLVVLWICGRLAITFSIYLGWGLAMLVDMAFLSTVIIVTGREIIAGENWKNIRIHLPLTILLLANGAFHLEAHFIGVSDVSRRLALAAVLLLIMIIGGRIVPSFTRNWLVQQSDGRLPAKFGRMDTVSIVIGFAALAAWVILADGLVTGLLLLLASVAHFVRLARWAGGRTLRNPLVAILHVSYLFIPIGLLLLASSLIWPEYVPQAAGIHALGVGAIGSMTLSVMVRATLGHTGQKLKGGSAAMFVFLCVIVSALIRIFAAFGTGQTDMLLHTATYLWFFAFAGFGIMFSPLLLRRCSHESFPD